jgi:polar amino acid transport system permease protein
MAFAMINIDLIIKSIPLLAKGALMSLGIAFSALAIGLFGGFILALGLINKHSAIRTIASIYVNIIRGTPMLIQIVIVYYVLSPTLGLSALAAAIIAIGGNSAAYVSQIIKAGILSVSRGQIEAAKTLGIRRWDIMRYIILPQALQTVLPALGNESVTLIKDSSLASLIGVRELYKQGQMIMSATLDALSVYFAVALIYLLLTGTISFIVAHLEKAGGEEHALH